MSLFPTASISDGPISRTSTGINRFNPPYLLDLDMAMTLMEDARSPGMTSTTPCLTPWLGLGGSRPLNLCILATTRWSVYNAKCLGTIIHLFYLPIKPSIPNSNFGQGESSYAGYHFDTGDQVPGPTMNFSPQNPGVNTNQVASPVWRFHNCWVSHSEQDEVHLTIALKRT